MNKSQTPTKKLVKMVIDSELCKGCKLCISACPQNTLETSKKSNTIGYFTTKSKQDYQDNCALCTNCATICPEICIEIYKE